MSHLAQVHGYAGQDLLIWREAADAGDYYSGIELSGALSRPVNCVETRSIVSDKPAVWQYAADYDVAGVWCY